VVPDCVRGNGLGLVAGTAGVPCGLSWRVRARLWLRRCGRGAWPWEEAAGRVKGAGMPWANCVGGGIAILCGLGVVGPLGAVHFRSVPLGPA